MLNIIKKVFNNSDKETIRIFEEVTRIKYDPKIFNSLKVLSISHTKLQNLNPLKVFKNLEVLNLSHNEIEDIRPLEELKNLKIVDLRFNKIKRLPSWIFTTDKEIHWERVTSSQEGIFLEGNPIGKERVLRINQTHLNRKREEETKTQQTKRENKDTNSSKNFKKPKINRENPPPKQLQEPKKTTFSTPKPIQLIPLNRQKLTIFKIKNTQSKFIEEFVKVDNIIENSNQLKLNISIIDYIERENETPIFSKKIEENLKYAILILNETKCCLYPSILKEIVKENEEVKIFLVIEDNSNTKEIKKRIDFLRSYNRFRSIIDIYHSTKTSDNRAIREHIYNYLDKTPEVNSLWKKSWIELRDRVEEQRVSTKDSFDKIAKEYNLSSQISNYLFWYLKRVGSILS